MNASFTNLPSGVNTWMRLFDAVADVEQAVDRELGAVHRVAELLRRRRVGVVGAEVRVVRLVAVGAPVALEARRCRRRAPPRACSSSRPRCRPRCPSGRRRSSPRGRSWSGRCCRRRYVETPSLSAGPVRALALPTCSRNLPSCVNFRICESPVAVAADPDVALVVHGDAVVRRRPLEALAGAAPVAQQVAGLVELEHRRRAGAALAGRRRQLGPFSLLLSVAELRWMIQT